VVDGAVHLKLLIEEEQLKEKKLMYGWVIKITIKMLKILELKRTVQ